MIIIIIKIIIAILIMNINNKRRVCQATTDNISNKTHEIASNQKFQKLQWGNVQRSAYWTQVSNKFEYNV